MRFGRHRSEALQGRIWQQASLCLRRRTRGGEVQRFCCAELNVCRVANYFRHITLVNTQTGVEITDLEELTGGGQPPAPNNTFHNDFRNRSMMIAALLPTLQGFELPTSIAS